MLIPGFSRTSSSAWVARLLPLRADRELAVRPFRPLADRGRVRAAPLARDARLVRWLPVRAISAASRREASSLSSRRRSSISWTAVSTNYGMRLTSDRSQNAATPSLRYPVVLGACPGDELGADAGNSP